MTRKKLGRLKMAQIAQQKEMTSQRISKNNATQQN